MTSSTTTPKAIPITTFSRGDFGVGVGGQGDPTEAYTCTTTEGRPQSRHPPYAKSARKKVPTTGLEPVRRFRHQSLKLACLPIPARGPNGSATACTQKCSRRDSNPHGVNPHRVLNPARLPIPPPEPSHVDWSRGESNP